MAKNTSSSAFRKINVDQYNEDNFKEDEIDSNGTAYTGPDDAEITKLINTGKGVDALKSLLENAPLTSKNQQAKVQNNDLNFALRFCDSKIKLNLIQLCHFISTVGKCPTIDAKGVTFDQIESNGQCDCGIE